VFADRSPRETMTGFDIVSGMTVNRSAPWARIVPVLAVADVRQAAAWYVRVLGLVEYVRVGEGHRVQLGFDGERAELIVRELGDDQRASETTDQVMVRVDDVGAVLKAARSNGADASDTAHDYPYGERQARFVDPFGHTWVVTETLDDVDPSEWGGETVVPRR
jgi:PhnB protein